MSEELQCWTLSCSSLHQCRSPPIDLKCAPWPSIDPGGGRISPAVGGSARPRSFWLCYGREAILEICLLCSIGRVGTCVQTFDVYFSRSEYNVEDLPVRGDGPVRFSAPGGGWRRFFPPSLDYSNNNIHGLWARGQVLMLNYSIIFYMLKPDRRYSAVNARMGVCSCDVSLLGSFTCRHWPYIPGRYDILAISYTWIMLINPKSARDVLDECKMRASSLSRGIVQWHGCLNACCLNLARSDARLFWGLYVICLDPGGGGGCVCGRTAGSPVVEPVCLGVSSSHKCLQCSRGRTSVRSWLCSAGVECGHLKSNPGWIKVFSVWLTWIQM